MELADSMNAVLSPKWAELRGISIVSVGVTSVSADPEDEERIKKLQNAAASTYGTMAVGEAMLNASQAGGANGTGDANGSGGFMGLAGMAMAGMMANNMSGGQGGGQGGGFGGLAPHAACCGGRGGCRRLDLPQVRQGRQHRQVLRRVRREEARGAQGLDLP